MYLVSVDPMEETYVYKNVNNKKNWVLVFSFWFQFIQRIEHKLPISDQIYFVQSALRHPVKASWSKFLEYLGIT